MLIRQTSDWPAQTITLSFTHRKCRSPAPSLRCSASLLASRRLSCPQDRCSLSTERLPRLPPGSRRHLSGTRRLPSLWTNSPTSTPPYWTQGTHTRVVRVLSTRRFIFSSSLKSSEVRSTSPGSSFGGFSERPLLAYRHVDCPRTVLPTSLYHHVSV